MAGGFSGWLHALFGLFLLLSWFMLSTRRLLPRPPGLFVASYFLLSTICLSVRLFLRVFLPNVGKAQGVCG